MWLDFAKLDEGVVLHFSLLSVHRQALPTLFLQILQQDIEPARKTGRTTSKIQLGNPMSLVDIAFSGRMKVGFPSLHNE